MRPTNTNVCPEPTAAALKRITRERGRRKEGTNGKRKDEMALSPLPFFENYPFTY